MSGSKCKVLKVGINACIFIGCLVFVGFQCYECIEKYVSYPQSTQLLIDSREGHLYPEFTLCVSMDVIKNGSYYDQDELDDCGLR